MWVRLQRGKASSRYFIIRGDTGSERQCVYTYMAGNNTGVISSYKAEQTSACSASWRHQSAVMREWEQTNSIWRWLKCLSPSVLSEKLLRLSPSARDQTSVSACFSPFTTNLISVTFLQTVLRRYHGFIDGDLQISYLFMSCLLH